jgi:hypothetical protein
MVFENGFAANEFELQEKLNAFILSIGGWTKVSQPSEFESVYYSNGEDGYKDIYIKSIAGLSESASYYGGNQKDFGDGYVGYLNFFAYQFYPEDGDGYDGYGEAGKFGPFLIWIAGNTPEDIYFQRFSQQSSSERKWSLVGDVKTLGSSESYPSGFSPEYIISDCRAAFDGKRFIYWNSASGSDLGFFKYNIGGEINSIIDVWLESDNVNGMITYYVDPVSRKKYVWEMFPYSTGAGPDGYFDPAIAARALRRRDLSSGVIEYGFNAPVWERGSSDYYSKFGPLIWDGHNHLYKSRGMLSATNWSDEWGKYNIQNDEWTMFADSAPIPIQIRDFTWLDKKTSGFSHHRIYAISENDNVVYYISIDENSGMPVGTWTSAGALPEVISTESGASVFHNQTNRFYYYGGGNKRFLYYAEMVSGTLSWNLIDANYMPSVATTYDAQLMYSDGYVSRVRTSLHKSTEYWFFGSKDHIMVVTESDDESSYCYMGAIDAFSDSTLQATTTQDIYPGTNVEIPINTLRGEFVIGNTVSIVNITEDGGGTEIGDVENIERKFMPTETLVINNVILGSSIVVDEVKNTYRAGSKISYDPQPIGITMEGLDKIQMLNSIDTVNTSGGFDMAENIAYLQTVRDELVNSAGYDDRHNAVGLWPILIVKSSSTSSFSGSEARGSLKGVFAISGDAGISVGDTISVGSNTYRVFDVPTSKPFLYAIGPIR